MENNLSFSEIWFWYYWYRMFFSQFWQWNPIFLSLLVHMSLNYLFIGNQIRCLLCVFTVEKIYCVSTFLFSAAWVLVTNSNVQFLGQAGYVLWWTFLEDTYFLDGSDRNDLRNNYIKMRHFKNCHFDRREFERQIVSIWNFTKEKVKTK